MTTEEWVELCGSGEADVIEELMPLQRRSYIREWDTRLRKGSLDDAISAARHSGTELWVCSNRTEAYNLLSDLAAADAFAHVVVFTDLSNGMGLGAGRHRIDQCPK
jgi:hypothetical protein